MSELILLVEDDPDDEALILRALRQCAVTHEVVVVRDGAEALDWLVARSGGPEDLPSVVLLDLKLPKIGGLEVLRRIRESVSMTVMPVVVLTSSNEECDLLEACRLGANSYVLKPVDFVEFARAVQLLGQYWLAINMPPTGMREA
jgi:two-component system response regulator